MLKRKKNTQKSDFRALNQEESMYKAVENQSPSKELIPRVFCSAIFIALGFKRIVLTLQTTISEARKGTSSDYNALIVVLDAIYWPSVSFKKVSTYLISCSCIGGMKGSFSEPTPG